LANIYGILGVDRTFQVSASKYVKSTLDDLRIVLANFAEVKQAVLRYDGSYAVDFV